MSTAEGRPRRPAAAGHRPQDVRLQPDVGVDAAGVGHAPAGPDARIVCLVPSITELLCDLGLAPQLVGRTGFCIHPREVVKAIPKVGGTKDVKLDRIRELAPTHVVVNVDENRLEDVEELATFVPSIVVTHPLGPLDNPSLYRLLGGDLRAGGRGGGAVCAVRRGPRGGHRARAARARRPLPDLARAVDDGLARHLHRTDARRSSAGRRCRPRREDRYPTVELPADGAGVDLVLLPSEPYRFREKHVPELEALAPRRAGVARRRRGDLVVREPRDRGHPGARPSRRRAHAGMTVPRFMIPFGSNAAFSASSIG